MKKIILCLTLFILLGATKAFSIGITTVGQFTLPDFGSENNIIFPFETDLFYDFNAYAYSSWGEMGDNGNQSAMAYQPYTAGSAWQNQGMPIFNASSYISFDDDLSENHEFWSNASVDVWLLFQDGSGLPAQEISFGLDYLLSSYTETNSDNDTFAGVTSLSMELYTLNCDANGYLTGETTLVDSASDSLSIDSSSYSSEMARNGIQQFEESTLEVSSMFHWGFTVNNEPFAQCGALHVNLSNSGLYNDYDNEPYFALPGISPPLLDLWPNLTINPISDEPGLSPGTPVYLNFQPSEPVPEPTTMILLGAGLIGIAGISRKRKK